MNKKPLPELKNFEPRDGIEFDIAPGAMQRWNAAIKAEDKTDAGVISVYGAIGETWDGTGITPARIAGALRAIGDKDVTVNINSPGGDVFAGIAIYNLLRSHPKNVTVRVIGLAASAASVIAMAGDKIEIGRAAFLMIHNVWLLAMGNRNDLRAVADTIEPVDRALSELYAARSGNDATDIAVMMDKETWIGGDAAVEQGFADALLPADEAQQSTDSKRPAAAARLHIQAALAKAGYSRSQQRELIKEFSGMPGAAANATLDTPGAVAAMAASPVNQPQEEPIMDLKELQSNHPDLYRQISAQAADAERARIMAVEAQALPGHEALINNLKADGKTTGPEAAVMVLAAEKQKGARRLDAMQADASAINVPATPTATGQAAAPKAAAVDEDLPIEERAKAAWDADGKLRAEFGGKYDVYLAYAKADANGQVKILSRKAA